VFPMPVETRTFELHFATAAAAFAERDRILQSVLQPSAIDIVNWPDGYRMLVGVGGSRAVLDRYARELRDAKVVDEAAWDEIRNFSARLAGTVVPMSMKLSEMAAAMEALKVPAIARAGNGVIYAHYSADPPQVAWNGDFATVEKVKNMFDPERLLNRGRLYGRI